MWNDRTTSHKPEPLTVPGLLNTVPLEALAVSISHIPITHTGELLREKRKKKKKKTQQRELSRENLRAARTDGKSILKINERLCGN